MAAVIGLPKQGKRGVVVFTTGEGELIERLSQSILGSLLKFKKYTRENARKKNLQNRLTTLANHYNFGIHFNSWKTHYYSPYINSLVKFYLGTNKVTWAVLRKSKVIKTTSSFMVPAIFNASKNKEFDICYIATDSDDKNWSKFFQTAKKLLEQDSNIKILAIQTTRTGVSKQASYIDTHLHQWLGNQLIHLVVKSNGATKGLEPAEIANYLARSKVFVHFSKIEGQSTVISEASLSGCKIVLYPTLKFFSVALPKVDYVTTMIPGFEHIFIKKAIKKKYNFGANQGKIKSFFGEEENVKLLCKGIVRTCGKDVNLENLEDLKFRLPGHTDNQVFWLTRGPSGSRALCSLDDLDEFIRYLEARIPR